MGKYRTATKIQEFTGPLGSLQQLMGQLSLSSLRGRQIEYQLHMAGVRAGMSADMWFSTKTGCI